MGLLVLAPACQAAAPAKIGHAFVIVLENEDANTTFGPGSQAPYLADTLTAQGAFVPNYYGIAHNSLPNYLAMVSGQSPTVATQADCPAFTDVLPGLPSSNGQVVGQGCVYPASVNTIAGQLEAKHMTWKGYMEDMGDDPARDGGTSCAHPAIGAPDTTQQASPDDQYATRHNPFVYFHSVIDRTTTAPPATSRSSPSRAIWRRSSPPRTSRSSPRTSATTGTTRRVRTAAPAASRPPTRSCAPGSRASPPPPPTSATGCSRSSSTRPPRATRAPAVVSSPARTPRRRAGRRAAGARARCCSRRGSRLER